jgi:hypothetical protein
LLKNPELFGSFARTTFRPEEDIYSAIDLASSLMFYSPNLPQKWEAQFPHPQQNKIPRVRIGRQGIPAER